MYRCRSLPCPAGVEGRSRPFLGRYYGWDRFLRGDAQDVLVPTKRQDVAVLVGKASVRSGEERT